VVAACRWPRGAFVDALPVDIEAVNVDVRLGGLDCKATVAAGMSRLEGCAKYEREPGSDDG